MRYWAGERERECCVCIKHCGLKSFVFYSFHRPKENFRLHLGSWKIKTVLWDVVLYYWCLLYVLLCISQHRSKSYWAVLEKLLFFKKVERTNKLGWRVDAMNWSERKEDGKAEESREFLLIRADLLDLVFLIKENWEIEKKKKKTQEKRERVREKKVNNRERKEKTREKKDKTRHVREKI